MNPLKGWQSYAACKGLDPNLFTLDDDAQDNRATLNPVTGEYEPMGMKQKRSIAKAVCKACPVQMACLETKMADEIGMSIATRERMIYGGMSNTKRYRLQQQRDIAGMSRIQRELSRV